MYLQEHSNIAVSILSVSLSYSIYLFTTLSYIIPLTEKNLLLQRHVLKHTQHLRIGHKTKE